MKLIKRLEPPSVDNKYYVKTTYGGYNKCIVIDKKNGCVLPNCTGYAWGRFIESQGIKDCNLSRNNAECWYLNTSDGYKRSSTPKLGAIICWKKGDPHSGSDGKGHVAFVEDIYEDGSILISESGYDSYFFKTEVVQKPYKRKNYDFQGFILSDVEFEGDTMFNINDIVECINDTKLYTTVECKESKYTIKKGQIALVKLKYGNNFIALADVETGAYFPSAWTKEQNNFTLYEEDYKKKYEEEVIKNKMLQEKIDKAINDLK